MKLTDGLDRDEVLLTPEPKDPEDLAYRMVAYLSGNGVLAIRMDMASGGRWTLESRQVLERAEWYALGDLINTIRGKTP